MANEEKIKIASEWWRGSSPEPTNEQKKRLEKTGSLYKRDEQISKYTFSKGEFV